MKKIALLIFLIASQTNYSQKKFSIEVLTGYGFNKDFSILNAEIDNYINSSNEVSFNYRKNIYKSIFLETGLVSQFYYSTGTLKVSKFKAKTIRLGIPLSFGFTPFKKVDFTSGIILSNNRDFVDFNNDESDNIRFSLLFKTSYALKENLSLVLKGVFNVSGIPNSYLLNQPSKSILIGASYKLF